MQKTLTALLPAAIAIIVLPPLFAAQSLSASIASSFGMAENATSVIAMMPMLGYATGARNPQDREISAEAPKRKGRCA
jgi:hypothetical protein